ncbi:putative oxidoreductase-like protein [Hapsidospora chrysogenum ATCC 11550]|uniref:Putative oxidoreductase-like protein n=1 Tax=Hapsidospora chrysogenum (strain ATCC 11550 / CBS 779.69 / DSM 880 / IAM 14645 / JCM 23072 / IMI 49137) TaxID=857340 RepID=A0A086TFP0_HAPC1|nr:putative oxidoreductase-like protein [Hapsidospora chrysogenum ATCC 11550]
MSTAKRIISKLTARSTSSQPAAPVRSTPKPKVEPPPKPEMSEDPPRFIVIGAGSRGTNYTEATFSSSNGIVTAIAEPIASKRNRLGMAYIWGDDGPKEGQSFAHWEEFLQYELDRRQQEADGKDVPPGVDGAFVCVMDEMHREVVVGLAPLNLHIMCEKPLACSLEDCLEMYRCLKNQDTPKVFSVGHVLRYSPHNIALRKMLVEDKVIGEINSVVHTEPVGWWHYTHSYVRGNWRNSETTGPSLLTKSCHDIDLLLWFLCSPAKAGQGEPHLPSTVSSTGGLQYFKKSRKPAAAGTATNCFKCPLGDQGCKYSAKNIYLDGGVTKGLGAGNTRWPVNVVVHDIEDYGSRDEQAAALAKALEEDYDEATPASEVASRNWFGRCVYESDNNVCDEQFVTLTWAESGEKPAKRVAFHMVAQTIQQCDRYANYYGENGEIYADSKSITIIDFNTGEMRSVNPKIEHVGHGGGDIGLTRQFVLACDKVKNHGWETERAQNEFIGCTLEEVIRTHAMVFAAEEARLGNKVVDWEEYWAREVATRMRV